MQYDLIINLTVAIFGLLDCALDRFTGRSLMEWLIPERRRDERGVLRRGR